MEEVKIRAPRTVIGDFIVGVNAMKAAPTARKQGVSGLRITPIRVIPSVKLGYWSWTAESTLPFPRVPDGTREAVKDVFNSFDADLQQRLTFGPAPGEWVERVQLWQQALKPELTPQQYSAAVLTILDWAKRCVQYRLGIRPHPWIDKQEVQHG